MVLDAGDAEVGELDVPLQVEHDVRRLDVAVHDTGVVREVERIAQLAHDVRRDVQLEAFLAVEEALQFLAADELHDQVGEVAFLAEVVDLHDIGVAQPRGGLRLADESRRVVPRSLVVDGIPADRLDCHPALQLRVESLIDDAHRTLAEHALEGIPAESVLPSSLWSDDSPVRAYSSWQTG